MKVKSKVSPFQRRMVIITLFYGIVAGLIFSFWIALAISQFAVNGLPIGGKSWPETWIIFGFLVTGPIASFAAGMTVRSQPSMAALLLLFSGITSTLFAIIVISSDTQAIPLLVVTAFTLVIGILLKISIRTTKEIPQDSNKLV